MINQANALPRELKKDLTRNRDGRLSSRQWLELITKPLSSLLLLAVPLILLFGRYGVAGRYLVLLVVAGFGVTIAFRAVRFSRVQLHYRLVFVEHPRSRWAFWRKVRLTTKLGKPIIFDQHVTTRLNLPHNQAVKAYYIDIANQHILVSLLPEKHPQASFADPTDQFIRSGGICHED